VRHTQLTSPRPQQFRCAAHGPTGTTADDARPRLRFDVGTRGVCVCAVLHVRVRRVRWCVCGVRGQLTIDRTRVVAGLTDYKRYLATNAAGTARIAELTAAAVEAGHEPHAFLANPIGPCACATRVVRVVLNRAGGMTRRRRNLSYFRRLPHLSQALGPGL
jgi:hypothetical protein